MNRLNHLTHQDVPFIWKDEQQKAFDQLKQALLSRPILTVPDYNKKFHLFVDASGTAQGGALMQQDENDLTSYKAIGYWSRIISQAERKWPAVQLELQAIVLALRNFNAYFYNMPIIVHTDHKPLVYLMVKKKNHANLVRWAIELLQ